MLESIHSEEMLELNFSTKIEGYYVKEDPKSVYIDLPTGMSFWVPKKFIDSEILRKKRVKQMFIIDSWILRKIGFNIEK
ncbi:MAG: hypothetical protein ACXACY_20405 [Candidatus Hodarchaeales archaeon]|jgi:hypothetical protein